MSGFIDADGSSLVGALNPSSVGQALQVDAAGNLKVTPSGGGATTALNQASAAKTTNGNSADLNVSAFTTLAVDCNITAVSGVGPTLKMYVDRKGADGVYYPIWESITITSATKISTSIGPGMDIAESIGSIVILRWVVDGTNPSFTFSASLIAK